MEYTKQKVKALAETAHVFLDEERIDTLCKLMENMEDLAVFSEDVVLPTELFEDAITIDGMREDSLEECMKREDVLNISPAHTDGCVTVPRTVEEGI